MGINCTTGRRGPRVAANREQKILTWLAEGKTGAEVADLLGISVNTYYCVIRRLCLREHVHGPTALVVHAIKQGRLDPNKLNVTAT